MNIKILGNGGAFSAGLPCNSFIIDHHILIECPPDIVTSLGTWSVHPKEIDAIFISHFHGDHYFGFPFLALNLCLSDYDKRLDIYGPAGLKENLVALSVTAFGIENPLPEWLENQCRFITLQNKKSAILGREHEIETFLTDHYIETLGFTLFVSSSGKFTYLPDTRWNEDFKSILEEEPDFVICDLNGESDDKVRIHMCQDDIIQNALPLSAKTTFYGTHLRRNRKSTHPRIKYLTAGAELNL